MSNSVMESLKRAQKIIQMDAKGEITQKAKQAMKENRFTSFDEDINPNFIGENTQHTETDNQNRNLNNYNIDNNTLSKCKGMPIEILESFKQNRINTDKLNPMSGGGSVLDELEAMTGTSLVEKKIKQPQIIQEQHIVSQPINTVQSNIDYSMIKMIVEDCMKKSLFSIKKTLNENKLTENNNNNNNNNVQALKIGDKFSFITENGDLYEAKLEFVKNIKKKK